MLLAMRSRLIKRQPFGHLSMVCIGRAVHVGKGLSFASMTLKPASIASTVHGGGNLFIQRAQ
jgi:hypothetical protein